MEIGGGAWRVARVSICWAWLPNILQESRIFKSYNVGRPSCRFQIDRFTLGFCFYRIPRHLCDGNYCWILELMTLMFVYAKLCQWIAPMLFHDWCFELLHYFKKPDFAHMKDVTILVGHFFSLLPRKLIWTPLKFSFL
jgi:hypothetical protein